MAAPKAAPSGRSTWPGFGGLPLHVRHWPAAQPRGNVLIVHGIGEHSGRYDRTGRLLAAAGLDTWGMDLRGHGLSEGTRVYVRRWDDYLEDVRLRLEAARGDKLPTVLFGHSMGALISLTYVCSGRPAPDLLVLSAPPLDAQVPAWQRLVAPLLGRVAPGTVIANPIDGDQLSRDPAVAEAYFGDPLVQPRSTARLGAELFAAMKRARAELRLLAASGVPTLVIHGEADTLVPTRFSEPLGELPGVERRVLPGLRHETLNEPEGPQVVAEIVAWIRARLGSPAAAVGVGPATYHLREGDESDPTGDGSAGPPAASVAAVQTAAQTASGGKDE